MTLALEHHIGATRVRLYHEDAVTMLASLPASSVDVLLTDPPYPEIDRDYGRMSEGAWHHLMHDVGREARRVLKPSGSAVFILQPNSRKLGSMRPWLFDFMSWVARDWNLIQDVWWWNPSMPPTVHCQRTVGLMRPSVKACVWAGSPTCFRAQERILWSPSDAMKAKIAAGRCGVQNLPSGHRVDVGRIVDTVVERGGTTPYNLVVVSNADSRHSGGAKGHGAATPQTLTDWWCRYLLPEGGVLVDPFMGSGTVALSGIAYKAGEIIGSEKLEKYVAVASARITGCSGNSEAPAHTTAAAQPAKRRRRHYVLEALPAPFG